MKKIMLLKTELITSFLGVVALSTLILAGCSKESKDNEKHCPEIVAASVPQIVKDSFAARYPSLIVSTWFQKDSIGYCAYFIQPVNQKKLAEFSKTGVFVMEEIDLDHDGDFEDSRGTSGPKVPGVCECEIPE